MILVSENVGMTHGTNVTMLMQGWPAATVVKMALLEVDLLSEGGHGFGLAVNNTHFDSWTENLRLRLGWLNGKR